MGTFCHQLRPVKINGDRATPRHPRRLICVDTESYVRPVEGHSGKRRHTFRLAVATVAYLSGGHCTHREVDKFTSHVDFWRWLQSVCGRRGSTWIAAHNLGYDFTMLGGWRLLDGGDMQLVSAILEDPPTHLITVLAGKVLHWIDTLNYWRVPLSRLGESVGLPKLPMPSQDATNADWFDYCTRDVEIVERSVLGLIDHVASSQMCSWQPTAPALAWRCFLTNFYTGGIYIHDDPDANAMERACYYGGRVECFRLGRADEEISVVDCNGLYPSVMSSGHFPTAYRRCLHLPSWRDVSFHLASSATVAVVGVQALERGYPLRLSRGTVWAMGSFDTVLAGPELKMAWEAGDISKVYDLYVYDREEIFSGYIRHFSALRSVHRSSGNFAGEQLAKLMLNSLHGKFGQRGRRWVSDPGTVPARRWGAWVDAHVATGERRKMRAIAGFTQRLEDRGESPHSFPGVSAYVTSLARVALQKAIGIAGREHVLYTDTDCLHVTGHGYRSLKAAGVLHPTEMGRYKLVCQAADAEYRGPKDYRIGEQVVCSGLKSSAIKLSEDTYQQERWPGIAGVIQSGPAAGYQTDTVTVRLSRGRYKDREVVDGWLMPLWLAGAQHEALRSQKG